MKKLLLLFICLIVAGCQLATKMNKVSLGMTKQEALKAMGRPHSTKASDGIEVLEYNLRPTMGHSYQQTETYWINYGQLIHLGCLF